MVLGEVVSGGGGFVAFAVNRSGGETICRTKTGWSGLRGTVRDRVGRGREGLGASGGRIGSYAVERKLGEGGMGSVYLARSRGGRAVAVKVAKAALAADPVFRERFRAEVAAARAVGGFHTAPVVDADPEAAAPWLATAYVPGPTLAERIDSHGPMGARELTALGAALAEALEAIHRCGLVHRDLKPGNIVMAEDGPRVLDFGIARAVESTRLTAMDHAFGTPGFLAPEQAEGADVTGAADVFALGAVLAAAAGGSAFGAGTPVALMYRAVHQSPDLSAVPDGVREVAAACLAKEPARRPGPARLLDWFEELAGGRGDPGEGAGADPREALLYSAPPSAPPPPYVPPGPQAIRTEAEAMAGPEAVARPQVMARPEAVAPPMPLHAPRVPAPEEKAFMAADADSSVVMDADGVLFVLYGRGLPLDRIENDEDLDQAGVEAEFAWAEIAELTHRTVRRTRLAVTVVLRDGSSYACEVNARRAARLHAWQHDLAQAVHRYLRR